MTSKQISQSLQKGLIFAIVVIFIVLTGFHVIAATLVSKAFGDTVMRGGIPKISYMVIVYVLLGFWAGWSASDKTEKPLNRILQGVVVGFSTGVIVSLFDLLLGRLITSGVDARKYLSELSNEKMNYFLLNLGNRAALAHLLLSIGSGALGVLLAIFSQSSVANKFFQGVRSSSSRLINQYNDRIPVLTRKIIRYAFYAALLVILFMLPSRWGSYWNFVIGLVGLYVIAGIGLNIIVGLSGQLVLGYAAFFAMGAYSVALLNAPAPHNLMIGFWPSLIVGVIMAVLSALILGLPIMRLRGDYLAIVTLGFGEIIRILLKSDLLTNFTGGPRGIHDIQGPTLFGKTFSSDADYVYLIFACVALIIFLYDRLQNSRTGRAWLAIKEDAIAAQANGINLQRYRLLALCIGAAFAGLAGGIFAARNQFTGPNDHTLMVSINILSILIVGGINSVPGIILGAFTLKGLPEILREIENYRLLFFGMLLIVMMLMRPNGLWPSVRPSLEEEVSKMEAKDNPPQKRKKHE